MRTALAILASLTFATPSLAQNCTNVANLIDHMTKYEGRVVAKGEGKNGQITVWVDRDGDFYIIGVPNGRPDLVCPLEQGTNWINIKVEKPENPT
jgi:hypothetical protein